MIKKISMVAGCIISLALIVGWFMHYDSSIVKAEDMMPVQQAIEKLNTRIDKSDLEQIARDYQRRIWQLEDRYGTDSTRMPPVTRNEYRCLVRDFEKTNGQIEGLGSGE